MLVSSFCFFPVKVVPAGACFQSLVEETRFGSVELGLAVEFMTGEIEEQAFTLGKTGDCLLLACSESCSDILIKVLK